VILFFFASGRLPALLMPIAIAIASILHNVRQMVWILTYFNKRSSSCRFLIALVRLGLPVRLRIAVNLSGSVRTARGRGRRDSARETMTHADSVP